MGTLKKSDPSFIDFEGIFEVLLALHDASMVQLTANRLKLNINVLSRRSIGYSTAKRLQLRDLQTNSYFSFNGNRSQTS